MTKIIPQAPAIGPIQYLGGNPGFDERTGTPIVSDGPIGFNGPLVGMHPVPDPIKPIPRTPPIVGPGNPIQPQPRQPIDPAPVQPAPRDPIPMPKLPPKMPGQPIKPQAVPMTAQRLANNTLANSQAQHAPSMPDFNSPEMLPFRNAFGEDRNVLGSGGHPSTRGGATFDPDTPGNPGFERDRMINPDMGDFSPANNPAPGLGGPVSNHPIWQDMGAEDLRPLPPNNPNLPNPNPGDVMNPLATNPAAPIPLTPIAPQPVINNPIPLDPIGIGGGNHTLPYMPMIPRSLY